MDGQKPLVALCAEPNALSISLVENLLANFCEIKIFTGSENVWRKKLVHVSLKNLLSFNLLSELETLKTADYFILDNVSLDVGISDVKKILDFLKENYSKGIFLLPYCFDSTEDWQKVNELRALVQERGYPAGIIYLGDILGPRMPFDKSVIGEIIKAVSEGKSPKVPRGNIVLYPVFAPSAAKEIVRSLFSFGPFGDESALISQKIPIENFLGYMQKIYPTLNYSYSKNNPERGCVEVKNKVVLNLNLEAVLKDTFEWFSQNKPQEEVVTVRERPRFKKIDFSKKIPRIFNSKWQVPLLASLVLLIILPYFLVTIGVVALGLSLKGAKSGNLSFASYGLKTSKVTALAGLKIFEGYSGIPIVGRVFSSGIFFSTLTQKGADTSLTAIDVSKKAGGLASNILGDNVYDPEPPSEEIALELDAIYRDTSFLQSEINSLPKPFLKLVRAVVSEDKLTEAREKVLQGKLIAQSLPSILGKDKAKTYLILFQNNMELRPAGGFIGSFALVTFDGGRLIDISVQDVYSADGQLKGHVEPPAPIKNYLGEANWYLRDSNWDPDFPVSAQRAEWFLDKEIDKSVEGVVALDLETTKALLTVLGPVNLTDFNQIIDAGNLYEKTQYEVESNFFPGSQKKSTFLTALTRELMNQLSHLSAKNYVPVALSILENLEARHIQIFVHDRAFQKAVSALGFDGAVVMPQCPGNCLADFLGVVDANVGVNKANYFIRQDQAFYVSLEGGLIKRTLSLSYENTANPSLGSKARYKDYVRVMVPQDSEIAKIRILSGADIIEQDPEVEDLHGRREAGVIFEIAPGQKKVISFSWESPVSLDFSQKGEYRLYVRKQAGSKDGPINLNMTLAAGPKYRSIPSFSLTREGAYVYNTNLSRDLFSRIYW